MEGGDEGAAKWRGKKAIDPGTGKRPVLYTLEDAIARRAPYVSLSGDPDVWPFGQRVQFDAWPNVIFRVVDTGESFTGLKKVYKTPGAEPIDVRVASPKTQVPELALALVVEDDSFGGGRVNYDKIRGQNMTVSGYEILGASPRAETDVVPDASDLDVEALSRAIESCRSSGTVEERQAVGWVCRNRAAKLGVTVCELLVPDGQYGPRGEGRDFVSTEAPPSDVSTQVARATLRLPSNFDPTGGATDFWCPAQQREQREIADALGDTDVLGEDEAREALVASGLRVVGLVGDLELLA